MATAGSVRFELADGSEVTVEEDDLRRVYQKLWTLTDVPGAVSAAALLIHEAERHPRYRQSVSLNSPQTVAFRRAQDQAVKD